jgi:hypothetical protein
MGEWLLSRRDMLIVARHEVPCPKGAGGLSPGFQPGFNPGNRRPERFALKGRQVERTNDSKVGSIVARLNCAR